MKKCPYCGTMNDEQNANCEKCFAYIPAEKPKEQPKKAKKPEKE